MRRHLVLPAAAVTAATIVAALTGCTVNRPVSATTAGTITVKATDTSCRLSASTARSGTSTFTITNSGTRATEFEILAKDGLTIVGEMENVAPGLTRTLSIQAQPGTYTSLCKPGMAGDGVGKAAFTVTGKSVQLAGDVQQLAKTSATNYVAYVRNQAATLLTETKAFAAAYQSGDTAKAKALYPEARAYYERIEPVAESFGDLDPELDAREGDVAKGTTWTGWHRIEKDLWAPSGYTALSASGRATQATTLDTKTQDLLDRVRAGSFTVTADTISNGAIGLLDEVATSKITGEEETFSHTDLWDFEANVQGAEVAYRGVRDIAKARDAALVTTLDSRFAALDALLGKYGSLEKGYVSYKDLSKTDVKALSDSVNALAEPLSTLTSTVLK
jgi:iron uptake system component EfeO